MSKVHLLEIEPKELKFIFELKKQSSCSVQLTNITNHCVAFKVKTTSPKKYSVRPNVGVLSPKATCEFIVTMQAQRSAPLDMECRDKFLIQSTMVSSETTSDDVTSSLFVKDGSRYIEENKLKVSLTSKPNSPEFFPITGDFRNGLDHEKFQKHTTDEIQSPEPMALKNPDHHIFKELLKLEEDQDFKPTQHIEVKTMKDVEMPEESAVLKVSKDEKLNMVKDVEGMKPEKAELKVSKALDLNKINNIEEPKLEKEARLLSKDQELKPVMDVEELKPEKESELKLSKDLELETVKNVKELKPEKESELKVVKGIEELKLMKAIEEMKLKLDGLESKLNESAVTISKLTEERRLNYQETKILQEKLAEVTKRGPRKVQVGFPFLYVCMVALVCVFLGYHLDC
ncbi:vesicle-associated protein 2-2 [Arachis duranensis]|uniref:Vesicle-associated protein 2-2 n=1 Tax=Arachis duranensis TaxID=130453 RepID=A0A6P4BHJ6_ARADU|nr:vesicle-associated protein 2-2 [Arachis duranensis]XP_025619121.1 vesicle-associated protein 2-2 isoform X1 [Arachis hypogaea]XP_025619122.1 vesicle-associated protein 2-2 isoform X1 [Arachis hypogaea]XP_025619123.1 vesicle-associated protein 2-2 isoform X1 [Arachis hypogaea]XP_052110235.1 vesicle-associated protein 2-2 [Arachis duranensis]